MGKGAEPLNGTPAVTEVIDHYHLFTFGKWFGFDELYYLESDGKLIVAAEQSSTTTERYVDSPSLLYSQSFDTCRTVRRIRA